MRVHGFEFELKVFNVPLFTLTKGSLSAAALAGMIDQSYSSLELYYAALFCAFRRLCAGVRLSLSSSLLPLPGA